MRLLLLIFILAALSFSSRAQYSETIRSGRPGASIGPFTVGKNVFQIQSGLNLGKTRDHFNSSRAIAVFRYGILERLELSTLAAYSNINYIEEGGMRPAKNGLSAAQIGFRVNILDNGNGPNIGFQSRLKLNILDDDFEQPSLASIHILILSQKLGNKLGVIGNLGINTKGSDHDEDQATGLYVLNMSMPVGQKLSVFMENYGSFGTGLETRFDTGCSYLVNPNFQLDASLGYGKNHGMQDIFLDFGFSWRRVGKKHRY